jgi:serine/threonine protein kinase/tetratricopeptide (TPR) repeat protein
MPPASDKIKAVFLAALDMATPAERAAFLDEACAADAGLRPRVEALLRAHDQRDDFLDRPPAQLSAAEWTAATAREPEQPGATVAGRYRLLEPVGEGGMGTVWLAEQTQPVRRRVALKLIKLGLGSKSVLARFEAERQALALMDHPNIAKVLDGGTTEEGRPFFVMEYVQGLPITQYCDGARLGVAERLALFVSVCQAVQHAHQKGVIHRDLKPSNLLVSVADGVPVPKVIDFGLAKALHQPLTEQPQETAHGVMVGTPLYMSPEQAEFHNPDVDTRADIYALGVILYELLTGTTPLEKDRIKDTPWPDVLRWIKEEEPPRPSARLGGVATPPGVAGPLSAEPRKMARLLRGELDWIVLKCLEKDRARRYETANALARDVQRYLNDEVVEARPPGTAYRLGKWLRKNRGPVVAAGLVLLALLGGVVGTAWGLVQANEALASEAAQRGQAEEQRGRAVQQRDRAMRAEKLAQKRLHQVTEEHAVLEEVYAFLHRDLLAQADIANQRISADLPRGNPKLTVREALDRAAVGIKKRFAKQPLVEAGVRQALAGSYRGIGEYGLALPHAERAVALLAARRGAAHPETLFNKNELALLCLHMGKNDRAEQLCKEILRAGAAQKWGDHILTRRAKLNLASVYMNQKKFDQAAAIFREMLAAQGAALGADHPDILACKNNLATVYLLQKKPAEALPLLREVLEAPLSLQEPDHPRTLNTRNNLAAAYHLRGRHDKAVPLFEEVLKRRRAVQGDDHPETIRTAINLARSYRDSGQLTKAVQVVDEWWPRCRAKLDLEDPITRQVVEMAVGVYAWRKKFTAAEALLRDMTDAWKARAGPDAPQYAFYLAFLGDALLRQGKWADAERALRESLAIREKTEPDAWTTFHNRSSLGLARAGLGRSAEAEKLLVIGYLGLKQRAATIPPGSRHCLTEALQSVVRYYEALGPPEQAARWRKELKNLRAP